MDPQNVSDAAEALLGSFDANGFLPGDEGYVEPTADVTDEEEKEDPEVDAVEEDTPEESEEDDGEDEDSQDAEDKDKEETEDQLYDLEIDGEEYEVNLEELKSGYLRNESLVKRQTELESQYAQKEQELEEGKYQLSQELERAVISQAMSLQKFQNVDWEDLKLTDPETYREKRLEFQEAKEQFQETRNKQDQVLRLAEQAKELKHQAYVKTQVELTKKLIPEFEKDPETFVKDLKAYGKEIGFTDDEIGSIADARQLLALHQARLYSESLVRRKEAEKKKVSKDLPPVLKPGAPKAAGQEQVQRAKAAKASFGKSGSVADAAQLFLASGVFD